MVMMISMKFKLEFSVVCWECKAHAKSCNRTGLSDHIFFFLVNKSRLYLKARSQKCLCD